MNWNVLIVAACVGLGLTGCTMTPTYTRPAVPVPDQWPTGPAYGAEPTTNHATLAVDLGWREVYPDPKLRELIRMALAHNRDLQLAALRAEQARALYGIQRAELLPSIAATGSTSKQHLPGKVLGFPEPLTIERYEVSLGVASWEVDFFGRLRSLKEEALHTYLASEQAARSARLMLVASVANAYWALAADRENVRLAQALFATQEASLEIVEQQFQRGLIPEPVLQRNRAAVEAARQQLARLNEQAARDQNALDLLLGEPAPPDLLPDGFNEVTSPLGLEAGLSSAVLLRRPDVLAAEHQLRAANADIGAARAAFFPRISLTAALGTASADLAGLFKGGSRTWSYAPQIVMPLFDARTWSGLKAAKVQRQIAVTEYQRAIQNAFREVADALAARTALRQQLAAQQAIVTAAEKTYRLAERRFEEGVDSRLELLEAQRNLDTAKQGLVSLRLAWLANQSRLYAVLGGGWKEQRVAEAETASERLSAAGVR